MHPLRTLSRCYGADNAVATTLGGTRDAAGTAKAVGAVVRRTDSTAVVSSAARCWVPQTAAESPGLYRRLPRRRRRLSRHDGHFVD